jgi:hypothetical protein
MSNPHDLDADDPALLAELHAARSLARSALHGSSSGVSIHALWAHVRRKPGGAISFVTERAIRGDAEIAKRYRAMLASTALAFAPFAMAASDGAIRERRVGPYRLEIIEAEGEMPLLVLHLGEAAAPSMMDISTNEASLRFSLPDATEGAIILSLDPNNADAASLARIVRDPAAEIYFL